MNICGIICEYNPFHNGHLYQLNKVRELGADGVVCVMSGNFVQRGSLAIMSKGARAETAIRCGADLVIELPVPYALSSAERFAYAGVSILNALGTVSRLSFGCETADSEKLYALANLLSDPSFDSEILNEYKKGVSYPAARYNAVKRFLPLLADILNTPNNILAIEYIKALISIKSEITVLPIPRKAVGHDDKNEQGSFASASHIRQLMLQECSFSHLLPDISHKVFDREINEGHAPVSSRNFDNVILAALKRLSVSDFLKYADISEGLESRLFDAVSKSTTLDEAIERCKTKRYTRSRIQRILLNAFLDIDSCYADSEVPYARILAFNETGRKIVKESKKTSAVPIITRPSSIKNESKKAQHFFALERRSDDIYSLFMKSPLPQGNTLIASPTFLSGKI